MTNIKQASGLINVAILHIKCKLHLVRHSVHANSIRIRRMAINKISAYRAATFYFYDYLAFKITVLISIVR